SARAVRRAKTIRALVADFPNHCRTLLRSGGPEPELHREIDITKINSLRHLISTLRKRGCAIAAPDVFGPRDAGTFAHRQMQRTAEFSRHEATRAVDHALWQRRFGLRHTLAPESEPQVDLVGTGVREGHIAFGA